MLVVKEGPCRNAPSATSKRVYYDFILLIMNYLAEANQFNSKETLSKDDQL